MFKRSQKMKAFLFQVQNKAALFTLQESLEGMHVYFFEFAHRSVNMGGFICLGSFGINSVGNRPTETDEHRGLNGEPIKVLF